MKPESKPTCRHCNQEPADKHRGLGARCYNNGRIRRLYPACYAMAGPDCVHCKCRKAKPGFRGLCSLCFSRPEVRAKYPKRINRWWERQESRAG
jgi:hypothetical protein